MTKLEFVHHGRLGRFTPGLVAAALVAFLATAAALPSVDVIAAGNTKVVHGTTLNKSEKGESDSDSSISKTSGKRRGKVLRERFDEQDLLRAYDEIKSEYHEKAFGGCALPGDGEPEDDENHTWKLLATMNPNKKKSKSKSKNESKNDEIIRVSMLEHPSDPLCPYVKMETVIPKPVEKCWDFLSLDNWDETMPKMDPFYEGVDIYGKYSVHGSRDGKGKGSGGTESKDHEISERRDTTNMDVVKMVLARKRTKRILAFGKREFVFVSVEDTPLEDGTWVSGTVSVEVREGSSDDNRGKDKRDFRAALPSLRRNKSYTRAFQDSIAFYKPLPASSSSKGIDEGNHRVRKGRTKLTIVCRIDLNDSSEEQGSGGCIPMWLYVKTIGITGARSVLNMRRCLLGEDEDDRK